jgi:hypothetical protein
MVINCCLAYRMTSWVSSWDLTRHSQDELKHSPLQTGKP